MALLSPLPFSPEPHSTQAFVSSTPENQLLSRLLMISIMPSGQFSFFIWLLFSPSFLVYFLLWPSSEAQVSYFSFYPSGFSFSDSFFIFSSPYSSTKFKPPGPKSMFRLGDKGKECFQKKGKGKITRKAFL